MKKTLTIIFLTFFRLSTAIAQNFHFSDIPQKDGTIFYEKIVELDSSFTQNILYQNAKLLFVKCFRDSKAVLQLEDKENGKIVGKGTGICEFRYALVKYKMRWLFTLDITVKNGKYRVQLYDFSEHEIYTPQIGVSGFWTNFPSATTSYLNEAMKGKNPGLAYYKSFHETNLRLIESIEKNLKNKSDSDF